MKPPRASRSLRIPRPTSRRSSQSSPSPPRRAASASSRSSSRSSSPPAVRRGLAGLLAVPLLAGCLSSGGGGGGGVPAPTAKLPAGARVAPASASAFVSLSTDLRSRQGRRRLELYRRFAYTGNLFRTLSRGATRALGSELDLVFLDFKAGGNDVVGLVKPKSRVSFNGLLKPGGLGGPRTVTAEVGGWTIFADSRALLDRFARDARSGKLADDKAFRDAMGRVDAHAAVRAYVSGKPVQRAVDRLLASEGAPPMLSEEVGTLVSMAFGASAEPTASRVDGVVRVAGDVRPNAYTAELPEEVPGGALVYFSFNHLDLVLKKVLKAVSEQNPTFEQQLSQLTAVMDITLSHDIYPLFSHEGGVGVYRGKPSPTIVLLLRLKDEARAKRLLGRSVTLAQIAGSRRLTTRSFALNGTKVAELDLFDGRTKIFAAVFSERLALANSESMMRRLIE